MSTHKIRRMLRKAGKKKKVKDIADCPKMKGVCPTKPKRSVSRASKFKASRGKFKKRKTKAGSASRPLIIPSQPVQATKRVRP